MLINKRLKRKQLQQDRLSVVEQNVEGTEVMEVMELMEVEVNKLKERRRAVPGHVVNLSVSVARGVNGLFGMS
jgi:hypothetical protein